MSLPAFSMRQLLEAGVHFGHQTHRWNPKMAPYIYGERNGIHIIDLTKTVPLLQRALNEVRRVVAGGGRVLFVGTKRQASPIIADAAKRCGQYYVNHRWLGGMLTNWRTISKSIKRLKALDEQLADTTTGFTKKELLQLTRQRDKLERSLGGIREMGGLPDILFVIDTNKEKIAIDEARRLNIPIVALVDTNCDPDPITYPVPGNDDATRAIKLYCDLMALAVLDGISEQLAASGADIGEAAEVVTETVVVEAGTEAGDSDAAEAAEADAAPGEKPAAAAVSAEPLPAATVSEEAGPAEAPAEEAQTGSEEAASADSGKEGVEKADEDAAAGKSAAKKPADKKATARKTAPKKATTAKTSSKASDAKAEKAGAGAAADAAASDSGAPAE